MPSKEARKGLKEAIKDATKAHGEGAVMLLGETEPVNVEVISTGLLSLDYLIRQPDVQKSIGIGGIPIGRVTELYGQEGGGKSTLLLQVIANAQRQSKRYCAIVDSEHAFDPNYAGALGVDVGNLVVSQPESGEEALDIAEKLIRSESVDLLAVDSVAMLTPKAELEGEIGDSHPGARARLVTQALSRLINIIPKHEVAVIFINQLREKIGFSGYGDRTSTPCGRSLKHNASLRIEVKRIGTLKIGERIVGARSRFRIAKNKIGGAPYQQCEADMIYGRGFCRAADLIDFGVERGVLRKSGATFEFGWSESGEKFTSGREAFRKALLENADLSKKIEEEILKRLVA